MSWSFTEDEIKAAMLESTLDVEDFNRLYQCRFEPDPLIRQYVELIKKSTRREISIMRREGLLSNPQFKQAQRIIWAEEDKKDSYKRGRDTRQHPNYDREWRRDKRR